MALLFLLIPSVSLRSAFGILPFCCFYGTFRKGPRSLKFFLAGGDGDSYKVFQNSAFPTLKLDYSFFDFLRSLFNFYF